MITNVCNLSCGGCITLCGLIPKDKLWFLPPDQLRYNIELITQYMPSDHYSHLITLFGGEPTLHPKWKEIIGILKTFPLQKFQIATNGRMSVPEDSQTRPANESHRTMVSFAASNIELIIDPKEKCDTEGRAFTPTLVAPIDYFPDKPKEYFWEQAKKVCPLWKGCGSIIYDNKGYICDVAGAMDQLEGGTKGWDVNPGKHPMDRTEKEIAEQGKNFCHRCAWSMFDKIGKTLENGTVIPWQDIHQPSIISKTNLNLPLINRDKRLNILDSSL